MVKRILPLALVALALAVVPAALADDGTTPPSAPAPAATGAAANGQQPKLRQRVHRIERRFLRRCVQAGQPSQRCVQAAGKILERLKALDVKAQERIAALQQCGTSSTDDHCTNADKRIARLQRIDARLQTLASKVQAWLDGQGAGQGAAAQPTSDAALDQAAQGLQNLAGQIGAGG